MVDYFECLVRHGALLEVGGSLGCTGVLHNTYAHEAEIARYALLDPVSR